MGASFNTMRVPGDRKRNEVIERFQNAQDQDRHENGHSYSGGLGMCTGLSFPSRTFQSPEAAELFLSSTAEKWEDALCVLVEPPDEESFWLIGGRCAS